MQTILKNVRFNAPNRSPKKWYLKWLYNFIVYYKLTYFDITLPLTSFSVRVLQTFLDRKTADEKYGSVGEALTHALRAELQEYMKVRVFSAIAENSCLKFYVQGAQ